MTVRIVRLPVKELSAPVETPVERQKSARGRPPGSKDQTPRKRTPTNSPTLEARVNKIRKNQKLSVAAAQVQQKIEETAGLTEDELLQRARSVPEARGGYNKGVEGMTEELAERVALAYRLSIRGLTQKQLAEQMDVSEFTAGQYLEKVRQMLKLDPKTLDVGHYMGESLAFFQEIRQMALLHASHGGNSVNEKLGAMRLALDAEGRKNDFLQKIGVYSDAVIERIERWLVNTTEHQITESPVVAKKVNLAAEIGRVLAVRSKLNAQVAPTDRDRQ